MVPAGRRPDDGHLSPGGAAAGRAKAPRDLSGPEKYSSQGPGAMRTYRMLKSAGTYVPAPFSFSISILRLWRLCPGSARSIPRRNTGW